MGKQLKVLLFGSEQECRETAALLRSYSAFPDQDYAYTCVQSHDEFEIQLAQWVPCVAVVLADGAAGMEGVYLARAIRPTVPVFWFSDDHDFAMQSHRLECVYFSTKPVTAEKLHRAVRQCTHRGIRLM